MTQEKRNTFLTSVPVPMLTMNREYDDQSEDKNDSELCNIALSEKAEKIIVELNSMHGEAKKKIEELIATLRADKLKDHEIKRVLFDRVNFVSRRTLYNALPQEFKREYTKPLPKTINISTPHNVIEQPTSTTPSDAEEFIGSPEQEIQKIGEIRRALAKQDAEEDDAQDLEIQFLKERVAELEDALHKTEMFRPATQIERRDDFDDYGTNETKVFEWLAKRDNAVTYHWYDNYGIELFKSRILTQLKGKGVTTFKRLYFEV